MSAPDQLAQAAAATPPPRLRAVSLSKRFGDVVANRDVSFELEAGQIHGLLGENGAGKSTLVNMLYGLVSPDAGSVEVDGRPVHIRSPRDAVRAGIGMVHQHFMLVDDMTVAENVALGYDDPRRLTRTRLSVVAERVSALSDRYGLRVDPQERIADLSVGAQQRVEILKLLYRDAAILVLDEPTAVLTPLEWEHLAEVLRALVQEGNSVLLITHKLEEMLSVADQCTVLRDGKVVGTIAATEADKPTLARMMVGREVVLRVAREPRMPGEPVLELDGVGLASGSGRALLTDVSFTLREGEIVGVAGVDGNGQRELAEVIAGVRTPTSGEIRLERRALTPHGPLDYARAGGAIVPEDRHRTAVLLDSPLWRSLFLKDYGQRPWSRHGLLATAAMRNRSLAAIERFGVRAPNADVRMRQLSGGNQQKVVLARELLRSPKLLVAAHPTRGLDVGAMEFVHARLLEHRRDGGATLLISSELDEILALSDRVAVMVEGHMVDIVDIDDANVDRIGLLMAGEQAA